MKLVLLFFYLLVGTIIGRPTCTPCSYERGIGDKCRRQEREAGCQYVYADEASSNGLSSYGCYKCE